MGGEFDVFGVVLGVGVSYGEIVYAAVVRLAGYVKIVGASISVGRSTNTVNGQLGVYMVAINSFMGVARLKLWRICGFSL